MEINTTLSNSIEAADKRASYDAVCKQILAEKIILAWIMKHTMKEFKDVPVQVIAGIRLSSVRYTIVVG